MTPLASGKRKKSTRWNTKAAGGRNGGSDSDL